MTLVKLISHAHKQDFMRAVPEEVLELSNLRTLEVMYNHLQTLPSDIGNKLGRLKVRYALYYLIAVFLSIFLRILMLVIISSANCLHRSPSTSWLIFPCYQHLSDRHSYSRLVELRQLDLSCNKLPHIPEEILRLPHLKFLSFGYNKLTNEEKKTLKKRFKD